ncbi:MAG: hypothetical protein KY467_10665 [Gemmatimonadetes bacterium]|nr:hypothetical protein [Gemmatimonadota bacterium]
MNDRDYPPATGPDPYDPAVRRKNVKTLAIVAVVLLAAALIPATYRRVQQPEGFYPTHAEAVAAQAVERGDVPGFVPATATEIHARNNRDTGQRFVRFTFADADLPAITQGMRLLPREEVEKVLVPTPGWTEWFPITSRTLSGTQGGYLQVYEIASGPDRGYLAVDPRTRYAYFWSRPGRRS